MTPNFLWLLNQNDIRSEQTFNTLHFKRSMAWFPLKKYAPSISIYQKCSFDASKSRWILIKIKFSLNVVQKNTKSMFENERKTIRLLLQFLANYLNWSYTNKYLAYCSALFQPIASIHIKRKQIIMCLCIFINTFFLFTKWHNNVNRNKKTIHLYTHTRIERREAYVWPISV